MIRDRLLSFNVKNGKLAHPDGPRSSSQLETINERSKALALKRKVEVHQSLNFANRAPQNAQHKAFWVRNSMPSLPSNGGVLNSYRSVQPEAPPLKDPKSLGNLHKW